MNGNNSRGDGDDSHTGTTRDAMPQQSSDSQEGHQSDNINHWQPESDNQYHMTLRSKKKLPMLEDLEQCTSFNNSHIGGRYYYWIFYIIVQRLKLSCMVSNITPKLNGMRLNFTF